VRGVTDLITMPGLVNLDFADIRTIMTKMGKAMMGTGEATGENRAILACEAAIANPLLDDISIKGAKGVLVNMTGGPDMTLFEADMAVNTIRKEVDQNANIIFGSAFDESMKGKIRISVVATGIDSEEFRRESFKSKETNEPSRFKAVVPETAKQNSSKSFFDPGVSAKPSKLDVEEISDENFKPKKIFSKEENLNYGKESENSTPRVDQENKQQATVSNFFNETSSTTIPVIPVQAPLAQTKSQFQEEHEEEWHEEDNVKFEEKIVEKAPEPKKPAKPAKSTEKTKKDSGGFSLFSFMNNKEKAEEPSVNSDNKLSNNIFSESEKISVDSLEKNEEKSKKIKQISDQEAVVKISSQEAEKKRQQFFGNTIFDEEVGSNNQEEKFDDDIINVPAFFRRKK
jgi:hypothetical protein